MLETAIKAAQQAGDIILSGANRLPELHIEQKTLNDFVSEVDRDAEIAIVETLKLAFPNHAILGEERGQQGDSESEYQWIIDPLDGTTNFLRAIPHYAVSIALCHHQQIVLGVVYDPIKQDLFTASVGQGAYHNGKLIQLNQLSKVSGGLYATGIPFSGVNLQNIAAFTNTMQDVLALQTSGIRRMGAAALDLAYVAAGRFDGFWEAGLKPWDMAAGILLIKEAGGVVSDFDNRDDYLIKGNVVTGANQIIHQKLLNIVAKNY